VVKQRLTKRLIDGLAATGKLYEIRDAEIIGFSLRVTPAGVKTYCYQWRDNAGRWRREAIGRHGTLTCDQARAIAQKWAARAAAGEEPNPKGPAPDLATMEQLRDRYMREHAAYKKPRSALNDRGYWDNHILPALTGRTVASITKKDCQALHLRLRATPTNANRVLEVLRKAMNLAEVWDMRPEASNPCRGIEFYKLKKRKRYLSPAEAQRLGAALKALDAEGGLPARFAALVRLEIYTGARKGEWLGAKWDDVDLEKGTLRLADTKSNEAQDVILPPAALGVLAGIKRALGNPYIIAGAKYGQPLQETRRLWKRLCEDAGISGLRMHDLRHSFASYTVTGTGNLAIVGGLLRHADPQTTARYAHLLDDPLRAAAHVGAGHLAYLIDDAPQPDNVVKLKRPAQ